MPRPVPEGDIPPGCRWLIGEPQNTSPFVQIHLPKGFVFRGKKSHAVSFQGDVTFQRGTRSTRHVAQNCVTSWAWSWWGSLSVEQQSGISASVEHVEKKQRVG